MRVAQAGFDACFADDMGLDKTIQTLAVLLARADGGPALVVAQWSVARPRRAFARTPAHRAPVSLRLCAYDGFGLKTPAPRRRATSSALRGSFDDVVEASRSGPRPSCPKAAWRPR
jgi:SNF2 family DNA or RNA helicase